jgi:HEAT repeat protein
MRNVIVKNVLMVFLLVVATGVAAGAQDAVERKVDSLFVIASSGSIMFEDMREPAMDSIAALGVEAVPYLIDKFTTRSARARWTIIWILQRIGTPAIPDLVNALRRPEGLVVQRVCWALGDVGDSGAVQPLIDVSDHARWQVRDEAVGALGKIGDLRAEAVVVRALTDSIGQVRKAAAVAAGRLVLKGYEDKLVHMLGDDFYGARMAAVSTLMMLDTAVVLQAVMDSVRSDNRLVGHLGCLLMGRLANEAAVDTLYVLTESDDPDFRAHAAIALFSADRDDLCQYRQEILNRETDRLVRLKMESALYSIQNVEQ